MDAYFQLLPWGLEFSVVDERVTATCDASHQLIADFFNDEVNGFRLPATDVLRAATEARDYECVSDTYGTNGYQLEFVDRHVAVEDPYLDRSPVTVPADQFVTALRRTSRKSTGGGCRTRRRVMVCGSITRHDEPFPSPRDGAQGRG